MVDNNMYSKMTMKELFAVLRKLRALHINGMQIIYPLTAKQKDIFKAFQFQFPE
jgi:hypothetical protein